MSKHIGSNIKQDWNATVDKPLAPGKDKRLKFEIECTAKIGRLKNSALIRDCEDFCPSVTS